MKAAIRIMIIVLTASIWSCTDSMDDLDVNSQGIEATSPTEDPDCKGNC